MSSAISVSFVGGQILIAAFPIPLKVSFRQCPVSEGMLRKKASESSHRSNPKYLFVEKLVCLWGGRRGSGRRRNENVRGQGVSMRQI